jgi:uncharacterized protein (DUF58 family)
LRGVAVSPVEIPALEPGQSTEVTLSLEPLHRGVAFFDGFAVTRRDPLGLWRAILDTPGADALVVLPQIHPVEWPVFGGSRHYQPGGISQASRVGDSEEFRSLRDYRPGDPLRAIHWRSWARTGRPVVKEHQEEYFTRHALVVDTAATTPMAKARSGYDAARSARRASRRRATFTPSCGACRSRSPRARSRCSARTAGPTSAMRAASSRSCRRSWNGTRR